MSIEVLDKENEMKTYLLITDTNNLSYISSIIASRKEVKIKSSQFSLTIRTRSFQKIMQLSSQISEEMIQLLLDGRIIKRLSTRNFQIPHSNQEDNYSQILLPYQIQHNHQFYLSLEELLQPPIF